MSITNRWDENTASRQVAYGKHATEREANVITTEDGQMLTTVGLDLGDKTIQACFVDHHGEIVEESRLKATEAALRRRFSGEPRYRMVEPPRVQWRLSCLSPASLAGTCSR